jgi:hypothetical protein
MGLKRIFRKLAQPSSLGGVSNLSILALILPEIFGRGAEVGGAVAGGVQAGIEAGGQAAASGVGLPGAIALGVTAAVSAALAVLRDDRSDVS